MRSVKSSKMTGIKGVLTWAVKFTQTGGLVQARDDDIWVFKVVWFLLFAAGISYSTFSIVQLLREYQKYDVYTSSVIEHNNALDFPAVTICNSNRIHCGNFYDLILKCSTVFITFKSENRESMLFFLPQDESCDRMAIYCELFIKSHCSVSITVSRFMTDNETDNSLDICVKYAIQPQPNGPQKETGWFQYLPNTCSITKKYPV